MNDQGWVKRWWEGEFIPHENDPHSSVVFVGGRQRRHWTARACRAVAEYARENHRWLIGTAIGALGVLVGIYKPS
jgi:hypothetical protein